MSRGQWYACAVIEEYGLKVNGKKDKVVCINCVNR